jgi:predicted transcriptional regulator
MKRNISQNAAKTMISKKSRLLVFDNHSNRLLGIITASDIVKAFRTTDINPPLEEVMTRKIFNLEYNRAIIRAIRMMHNRRIGSIIILDKKNTTKKQNSYIGAKSGFQWIVTALKVFV